MVRNRLALVAFLVAAAALVALLAAGAAPAEDLESKLDAKEAKLSKVRERSGVLTSTISDLGDRIDRLTAEVAGLRKQEAAVEIRLDAKQAELDRAMAQLSVAKGRLVRMRSHLRRALSALRERLVAMYETGTPDVLSVIVGANGYDDGGGLSTCYAHQETFAVSAGQQVSQGQIIGYSDCTGSCFGPHLHFEVRIDGEVTDPMAYL
jgi:septal ring factor EnvC (AmiA/AmiB activator)